MNKSNIKLHEALHLLPTSLAREPFSEALPQEQFHFSRVLALDRSIAFILLLGGVGLIISGFLLSLHHSTCGITRLLLGIAPAVAGGYHAYCLEAWRYEAHLNTTLLRWRCAAFYLIAAVLAGTILSLAYCG